jgi:ATP-dependent DNA helicase RecG
MNKSKKEEVMQKFYNHEVDVLVSTSVVEVGVNVPNATIIVIEGAERFGLAQLHQLRGRVLRGTHQPYCYLFTSENSSGSDTTIKRLEALQKSSNGFELAEMDMQLRGIGDLAGAKQWGISDLGMEAIKNVKMVEMARDEAKKIISSGTLSDYPILEQTLVDKNFDQHFE